MKNVSWKLPEIVYKTQIYSSCVCLNVFLSFCLCFVLFLFYHSRHSLRKFFRLVGQQKTSSIKSDKIFIFSVCSQNCWRSIASRCWRQELPMNTDSSIQQNIHKSLLEVFVFHETFPTKTLKTIQELLCGSENSHEISEPENNLSFDFRFKSVSIFPENISRHSSITLKSFEILPFFQSNYSLWMFTRRFVWATKDQQS